MQLNYIEFQSKLLGVKVGEPNDDKKCRFFNCINSGLGWCFSICKSFYQNYRNISVIVLIVIALLVVLLFRAMIGETNLVGFMSIGIVLVMAWITTRSVNGQIQSDKEEREKDRAADRENQIFEKRIEALLRLRELLRIFAHAMVNTYLTEDIDTINIRDSEHKIKANECLQALDEIDGLSFVYLRSFHKESFTDIVLLIRYCELQDKLLANRSAKKSKENFQILDNLSSCYFRIYQMLENHLNDALDTLYQSA